MRIRLSHLRQIIKEETRRALNEYNVSPTSIKDVQYYLGDYKAKDQLHRATTLPDVEAALKSLDMAKSSIGITDKFILGLNDPAKANAYYDLEDMLKDLPTDEIDINQIKSVQDALEDLSAELQKPIKAVTVESMKRLRQLRSVISEALEAEAESEIDELRSEPQMRDVESFAAFKLDNDEYEYGFTELQALARNISSIRLNRRDLSEPSQIDVDNVKKELADFGFKFVGREPIKQTRGYKTALGTHPFANSGGGGSGFGSGGFTSSGGGIGAIGSGRAWGDSRDLKMGAGRRK